MTVDNYQRTTYQIFFKKQNKKVPDFWNEAPPWVIKGGLYQYFLTTHFTAMWSSQVSMATPENQHFFIGGNKVDYGPHYLVASSHWWGKFYDPAHLQSSAYKFREHWQNDHWRRNYNGIFSAHVIEDTREQPILFAVSHGENKNELIKGYLYQNSVRTSFKADPKNPLTYSGGNPYQDCWEAYFGFLNGNWIEYSKETDWGNKYLNDLGPIAWPSAGYINKDGTQASNGLRHPSSIIHDGYLYIFVLDASLDGSAGIKLIRALLKDLKNPQHYEAWSDGKWLPALPEGFRKELAADYFATKGPESTPVFTPDRNTVRFSVAKFNDAQQSFVGVEEFLTSDGAIHAALRYSKDLKKWSERSIFYTAGSWEHSELRYPIFLNKDGSSNTEIDKDEFYILGTKEGGIVTKVHFKSTPAPEMRSTFAPVVSIQESKLSVSPNPSTNTFNIKIPIEEASMIEAKVYDIEGRYTHIGIKENITFYPYVYEAQVDTSSLPAGVYVLRIQLNDKIINKRLIKH